VTPDCEENKDQGGSCGIKNRRDQGTVHEPAQEKSNPACELQDEAERQIRLETGVLLLPSKRKSEERKKPSAQRRTTGPTLYTRAEERPASDRAENHAHAAENQNEMRRPDEKPKQRTRRSRERKPYLRYKEGTKEKRDSTHNV
jgi:hypothetical protein